MWQTGLLRPICLSVLQQGQGTFVMLTRVPDLSVAQLSLLYSFSLSLSCDYTATPHAIAKRHKVFRHTDTLG